MIAPSTPRPHDRAFGTAVSLVAVSVSSLTPPPFCLLFSFFDSPGLTIPGARLTLGFAAPAPAAVALAPAPAAPAAPPPSGVDFLNHDESSESDEVLIAAVAAEAAGALAPQVPFPEAAATAVALPFGSYANSEKIPAAPPPGGLEDMQRRGPAGCVGQTRENPGPVNRSTVVCTGDENEYAAKYARLLRTRRDLRAQTVVRQ